MNERYDLTLCNSRGEELTATIPSPDDEDDRDELMELFEEQDPDGLFELRCDGGEPLTVVSVVYNDDATEAAQEDAYWDQRVAEVWENR